MESSAATKGAVSEVRAGWIKAEEFAEDDLELILGERWFHILDAVDVGQPRDMFEKRWCGPGNDCLVDLEGCPTADFPCVEYIVGSDCTVVFERLDEKGHRGGRAPWVVPGGGSRCICKRCD